jgi:hypothetical protein
MPEQTKALSEEKEQNLAQKKIKHPMIVLEKHQACKQKGKHDL